MIKLRYGPGLALLALGTFVVGTDAHSVAGLLPEMAASFGTTIAAVGQSVTVFAVAYALLSPTLTVALATKGPRRVLSLGLLSFALGNVVTAAAGTMPILLVGRVIAAAGAAMFTPTAGAVAVRLAPKRRRGTALAIVTAGASSALVLGAPLGAALAAATSWRVTLLAVAGLGLLTFPCPWFIPAGSDPSTPPLRHRLEALRSPHIRRTLAVTVIAFAGVFIPYTFMSQSYAPLIAVIPGGISAVLLLFGITSVAGALSSGPLADRTSPRWLVVAATGTLALVDIAAVVGRESPAVLTVALLLAGYLSWSILAPQQQQLVSAAPEHAAVLISFNAAAGYLGITVAGLIGGASLTTLGADRFVLLAAALLLIAASTSAAGHRRLRLPAPPLRESAAGELEGGVAEAGEAASAGEGEHLA